MICNHQHCQREIHPSEVPHLQYKNGLPFHPSCYYAHPAFIGPYNGTSITGKDVVWNGELNAYVEVTR